ncbi:MAG: glycosyltransferase, partial [Candidatus Pacebacteria bacterium]|nr:glycosyltransferase [Candidatus Paceibacterota bacterium]
ITANGPGMDEIATGGQSCIYTQVKDEKSISDAMSLIYNSPLLKKALAENAARVAEKYGLDGFMRRLDTIYSTLN